MAVSASHMWLRRIARHRELRPSTVNLAVDALASASASPPSLGGGRSRLESLCSPLYRLDVEPVHRINSLGKWINVVIDAYK
uniref:Uncharacterized protein n=1 Tax=Leersia perrieri TaxID=77586 RepID=A0A0D9X7U4_9ORYZ